MRVKICGITCEDDAMLAEELGAHFIGLIFARRSPRAVTAKRARRIVAGLTRARAVGVFVEQDVREIRAIVRDVNLHAAQIYRPVRQSSGGTTLIRAVRVRDRRTLRAVQDRNADYILLDAYRNGTLGGTGESFDWSILPRRLDNVILAGGIGPDNVRAAAALRPYAVDVCSRVEKSAGIKDAAKLRALFEEMQS
ncbi:MAG: phosphoribosylanthranilate isomerase [Phycisphaerae bacterium]|nr:phosphoribosylanthranilate isomerase [Phycisphaerae bacterium]